MKLYRETKKSGLKVMNHSIFNHKTPYVYATTDKIKYELDELMRIVDLDNIDKLSIDDLDVLLKKIVKK